MARIPQDEIDRLKYSIPLARFVEARGITLRPHGAGGDLAGRCTWHEGDDTPSMVITPSKNLWHCFGCGAGGDVIEWVRREQGVSFRHAVELLRQDYGSLTAAPFEHVKISTVRKLAPPVSLGADEQEALDQVADYYHATLLSSPEALGYLDGRGLRPTRDLAVRFKLGYANRTLGYRLPMRNRAAGAELRGKLLRVGILRESGHELLTGCITFPTFGESGHVLDLYGRRASKVVGQGVGKHLYLPGPHRGVWNESALALSDVAILCEAHIDALSFIVEGHENTIAAYGVNGFTEHHLAALQRHGTRRLFIAYDRDDAGDAAAEKLAVHLTAEGIECYRVLFARGTDANATLLRSGPGALADALRNATWMGGRASTGAVGEPLYVAAPGPAAEAAKEEAAPVAEAEPIAEPPPSPPPEPPPAPVPSSLAAPSPITPLPPLLALEIQDDVIKAVAGDRSYRVVGLKNNTVMGQLRVNLLARKGDIFYVDTLDLYAARFRDSFITHAAKDLEIDEEVIKRDVGRLLAKLEELQEKLIKDATKPEGTTVKEMSVKEREAALALLRDPRLLAIVQEDLGLYIVGEEVNRLTAFLVATARKDARPPGVIFQSSSASGKSQVMDAVLSFLPEEELVKVSATTGQALFYIDEGESLAHKAISFAEQEGVSKATYALKLLQSDGELSIISTGKDPVTGKHVAHRYHVKGPVAPFTTTTATEVEEELQNRCLILTTNEDREQTRAIHRMQREQETIEGLVAQRRKDRRRELHQNAQRLLRPILVRNPYARELTFLDTKTRTRRDHTKYLALIRAVTLLHQYQRPVKTYVDMETGEEIEYIEVALGDIEIANGLAHVVLGRSLAELTATTERLLFAIEDLVVRECERLQVTRREYRFTRRQVLDLTGWSYTQLRMHLDRLIELEYVLVHEGGRGQSFVYELLYDGQGKDRQPFLIGLIDVSELRARKEAV